MNKIMFLMLTISMHNFLTAKSWLEILGERATILQDSNLGIIVDQYKNFVNNTTPTIANPLIKSIAIIDNGEQLVDIRAVHNNRIRMLPDPLEDKPFFGAAYNSGLSSASKIRKEVYLRLEKMVKYLDELSKAFGYKSGEISIKVFEGLRDLKTQEKLFQSKLNEIKLASSHLTDEEAEIETAKWVSPVKNNVPVHSTGAALDIRLWNEQANDFIDLGKFGVIWGENKMAPTFSENITDIQKLNRLYLLLAAAKAGLVNYSYEYWHFSFGDRYAVYWQEKDSNKRTACYGAMH